jgi:hypothetical protein
VPVRSALGPHSDAAPTPATASHRTPTALASDPAPTNCVWQPATDPAPMTASDHSRLDPYPGCAPGVKPIMLLPPPCRAPLLSRRAPPLAVAPSLSRPGPPPCSVSAAPFPCPNVSSPLQHPSNRCNIYSILLKHSCIVIATSR